MAEAALDIAALDLLVEQLPRAVFAAQRWFRSKTRSISDLALEEAAPLAAAPDKAASDAVLLIVRVGFSDGDPDERYLLPMVYAPEESELPSPSPPARRGTLAVRDASGRVLREPRDSDGLWRRLAAAAAGELVLPGLHGSFVFHVLPPFGELVPSAAQAVVALDERRLDGEQSNTSVVLGERLLLKLYRLLEPGPNPDLELPRFLSQAGFARVPAVAGYVRYVPARGEPSAAMMLQAFVPGAVDAWRWLLNELSAASSSDAALDAVGRIGEITARMHDALAARPDDPAFPVRDASADDLRSWRAAAQHQLDGALAALGGLGNEQRDRLARIAPQIAGGLDGLMTGRNVRVTRVHGDYHLGQLLRDRSDFWVIDFEGEPARPLAERRQPQSPLKDVAGMLRSLDYAARTVDRSETAGSFIPEAWLDGARRSFLESYRSSGGHLDNALLRAFELEKACYEVRYEANNRPDWVWLPLQALERLAADGDR
jgi:trehalose synthase-fused probable maltokinase